MAQLNGWLERKSIIGIWSKRYVILSNNKLSFYKKEGSNSPESEYDLDSETEVQHGNSKECTIRVKVHFPKATTINLRANSANDMLNWSYEIKRSALSNKSIYIGMFDIISLLGQGCYGKVTLCEKKGSKEIVAIKSVKKKKNDVCKL